MKRDSVSSGTEWEMKVGYSRAVRVGNQIFVSGTTATDDKGAVVGVGDSAAQTRFILEKISDTLQSLGASLADVVRTRMYVVDISRWEEIGAVHGEFFAEIRTAATMVEVARLIHADHLLEIEVDAIVSGND